MELQGEGPYPPQWAFKGIRGAGFVTIVLLKSICFVFHDENGQFKCILKSVHLQTLHQLYLALIYNDFNLITFPVQIFIHEWFLEICNIARTLQKYLYIGSRGGVKIATTKTYKKLQRI